MICTCGHNQDEHWEPGTEGADPKAPGSTACTIDDCDCICFDEDFDDDEEEEEEED